MMTSPRQPQPLGALACQRDARLQQLVTTVVTAAPVAAAPGKYEIVLLDTVLFPEGGGQPHDLGWIDDIPVEAVLRRKGRCVHIISEPLAEGATVTVRVQWTRRFDHMQHHSGQHLLSAVIQTLFGWKTKSWALGDETSLVELDTKQISSEQVAAIETQVNEHIRRALPIRQHVYSRQDLNDLEGGARVTITTKQDDMEGATEDSPVRLIEIEGIDSCTCCGTHLVNTAEMQAIKFLGTQPMRGNTRLMFVMGERLLRLAGVMLMNESKLASLLSCGRLEHADAVKRAQNSISDKMKEITQLNERLVAHTIDDIIRSSQPPNVRHPAFVRHHDGDSGSEFAMLAVRALMERFHLVEPTKSSKKAAATAGSADITPPSELPFVVFTWGTINGPGGMAIFGLPDAIEAAVPKLLPLMEAQGAQGKGPKRFTFNGKARRICQSSMIVQTLAQPPL